MIFVGMQPDDNFLVQGIDILGFEHIGEWNRLPLWPDRMQGCQQSSEIVYGFMPGESPFLN